MSPQSSIEGVQRSVGPQVEPQVGPHTLVAGWGLLAYFQAALNADHRARHKQVRMCGAAQPVWSGQGLILQSVRDDDQIERRKCSVV